MAILKKKAERDGFELSDEILNYIAVNIKSNIRELEGALNKLMAYVNLVQTEITMEIAKELKYHFTGQATHCDTTAHYGSGCGAFWHRYRTDFVKIPE
ncbi:MAG: DnaA/Hda family protein [Eubacterium ramulus]